jgi:hypothetical protein
MNFKKTLLVLGVPLTVWLFICSGCSAPAAIKPAHTNSLPETATAADQFVLMEKNGVQIDCPVGWPAMPDPNPDPNMIYAVSKAEFLRITTAVMPALADSYYQSLVNAGMVKKVLINGSFDYQNDYKYAYKDSQLISLCHTLVSGGKACHVMILCDSELLETFTPVFQHILNSVKFN